MSENTVVAVILVAFFVGLPLAIAAGIYAEGSGERACISAHCSWGVHGDCVCAGK